ncbi:MAG: HTTM domain-containing protein [Polyangiaceae bacterium]|nr:HTTM domain-containing protein [Polyangiaceae bacterium]
MGAALRRIRDELGDTYVLGAVRVVLGVLLFAQALRALQDLETGYFGDFFHWPMVPEAWVPSRAVYTVLVTAQVALAVLVVAGYRARAALAGSALLSLYVAACDRVQFHNNRIALAYFALLLSLSPCDRSFFIGPEAATRVGPLWAARLAQAQLSIIYLASGGSKLLDADWRSGRVLFERFVLYGDQAIGSGVPAPIVHWFTQPDVGGLLAKLAIATELLLPFALWLPSSRVIALWWGVWFHLTIEMTSRVEGFTWLTLAVYALFVTPDVRARTFYHDPTSARGRALARAVKLLDWLARFDVRPWAPDPVRRGHAVVVVGRDGRTATGLSALVMVARCVPLLFPLWVPLWVIAGAARARALPPDA